MATELEELGELIRLDEMLLSGRAQEIVDKLGVKNSEIARVIGVSSVTVWRWFNEGRRPRRATALRLADLLEELEVVDRAR